MKALAVLGTDTEVGKTVVMAALATALRRRGETVAIFKPVASGGVRARGRTVSGDVLRLKRVVGLDDDPRMMNPVCYRLPLAPLVAARLERRRWRFDAVRSALAGLVRHGRDWLLLEGVGGVLVPLARGLTVADLCRRLRVPVLLVARAGLGTINHTWCSVEALRARGVRVAGIVINGATGRDRSEATNPRVIEETSGVRVVAVLPKVPGGGLTRKSVARLAARFDRGVLARLGSPGGRR